MEAVRRARAAQERTSGLLQQYKNKGLLPANTIEQFQQHNEQLKAALQELESHSINSAVPLTWEPAVLVSITEAEELLWRSLVDEDKRFTDLEQQVTDLKQQLQQANRQVEQLRSELKVLQKTQYDMERLLLREAAAQTVNKFARHCVPSIQHASKAINTSLRQLRKHSNFDSKKEQVILKLFPDLEDGIIALKELAITAAHSWTTRDANGKDVPVSFQLLEDLIVKHYPEAELRSPVEQVVNCLKYLATEMNEDLFVPTLPEKDAGSATGSNP